MLNRRSLITGLIALTAAPAIVRATSIMPVKLMLPSGPVTVYVDPSPLLVGQDALHRYRDIDQPIFKTIKDAIDYIKSVQAKQSEIILSDGRYSESVELPKGQDHTLVAEFGAYANLSGCKIIGGNKSKPLLEARMNGIINLGDDTVVEIAASTGGQIFRQVFDDDVPLW